MASVPLVPALILGLASFWSSALILVCHILPLFPVKTSSPYLLAFTQTGRRLSASDCSYAWLSCFDFFSVTVFLVQIILQYVQGTTLVAAVKHGVPAACFWIAMTSRPSFFLVMLSIKVLQVRLRRPISYGVRCIYIWAPAVSLVVTGAITAALLAEFGFTSLFGGIASYLSITSVLSTCLLLSLFRSFILVTRRLQRQNDTFSWIDNIAHKRRQSFDTNDIQALKDGSSWITSLEGSVRRSLSAWSFDTSNTHHTKPGHISSHSFPVSFRGRTSISTLSESLAASDIGHSSAPPVPPLPSPYKRPTPRNIPRNASISESTNSWLTSDSDVRETMSSFSFPTTHYSCPAKGSKQIGILPGTSTTAFFPAIQHSNRSTSTNPTTTIGTATVFPQEIPSIKWPQVLIWIALIWAPYALAMPYIVSSKSGQTEPTLATAILFMLAMMAQSPLFLVAVFFKLPLPVHPEYASSLGKKQVAFAPKSSTVLPLHRKSTELRIRGKSSSFIVTEGRRSGDVWIDRGQAIAGLSKTGRLFSLLSPNPKLSVLPLRLGSDSNPSGVDHSTEHSARSNSILAYTISDKDVDEVAVVPRQVNSAMVNSWSAEQYESAGPANSRMGHKLQQGMACSYLANSQGPKLPAPSIPLPPIPDESDPLHSRRATHYMPAIPNHYDENLKQMTSDETISDHAPMRPQPNVREKISRERSESISSVATPDDHSTPHQRGFKTAHSMVPMPSLESTVYPALQDYLPFSFHQTESTDRCGMFEASRAKDDGFGRPLDSVICTAIHAEATFSANDKQKSHIRRAKIESIAATGSVARRRHKKRRYTPLEGAQRARNTRHRSHRPKDSKTLYTLKMRRSMESSVSTTPTEGTESDIPATIAAPVEYLPAINRLSTILTDHASRLMELSEAKSVPRSRLIPPPSCREDPDLLKQRNAKECIKSDKQRSFGKHEKENNGHSQASCLIPLERTASARQRSLLTQTQGLPTVVVRPPSTSVATDPVLMMCDEML